MSGELPICGTALRDADAIATLGAIWGPEHLEVGAFLDDRATLPLRVGRTAEAEEGIARSRAVVKKAGFTYGLE